MTYPLPFTCSFCHTVPVTVDLSARRTIYFCDKHRVANSKLISSDPQERSNYVKGVLLLRKILGYCCECGEDGIMSEEDALQPGTLKYFCKNHVIFSVASLEQSQE